MSTVIGRVKTNLGLIELTHEDGVFTTHGTYIGWLDGETHPTIIPVSRESAQEWFDICADRGLTFGEFPSEETTI